jgi:hypothetical protein
MFSKRKQREYKEAETKGKAHTYAILLPYPSPPMIASHRNTSTLGYWRSVKQDLFNTPVVGCQQYRHRHTAATWNKDAVMHREIKTSRVNCSGLGSPY